jgi:formylglycine-generating enzyme required for sulfatase activity
MTRKLRVFLCHASQDKPAVRELYKRLAAEAWIEPWLDEESLLPGQDFDLEIYKAARDADAIIICLSKVSVAKEGYVNREIRRALDAADEKPEGAIYIIPLRLDDCSPSFERLKKLQYADYFTPNAHERLLKSLRLRADALKIETSVSKVESVLETKPSVSDDVDPDLYRFIQIPTSEEVPYSFYIGKYPVTNAQYQRFLNAPDFADKSLWTNFPKYNDDCILIGRWRTEGWDFLQERTKESGLPLKPSDWDDENFGISNPDNPVVGVSWYESNAYCNWLMKHWSRLSESRANSGLRVKQIRLPLDFEWTVVAGGDNPNGRYPWDAPGKKTTDEKEIARCANVAGNVGHTTPVNAFLRGASPFGVMDMAGNIWEWQANYYDKDQDSLGLRGGSWYFDENYARVSFRSRDLPYGWNYNLGFRVVVFPSG